MYQSYASVDKDNSFSAQGYAKGPSFLYIEVDSLDDVIAATKGAGVVMPERGSTVRARSGKGSSRARPDFCTVRGLEPSAEKKEPVIQRWKRCATQSRVQH